MADRLVTIAKFTNAYEANRAKGALDEAGIRCTLAGETFASVYPVPPVGAIELQVFENEAERAKQILEEQNEQEQ
jgi:hypothetical protein